MFTPKSNRVKLSDPWTCSWESRLTITFEPTPCNSANPSSLQWYDSQWMPIHICSGNVLDINFMRAMAFKKTEGINLVQKTRAVRFFLLQEKTKVALMLASALSCRSRFNILTHWRATRPCCVTSASSGPTMRLAAGPGTGRRKALG